MKIVAEMASVLLQGHEMVLSLYPGFICSSKEGTTSLTKCFSNHKIVKYQLDIKIENATEAQIIAELQT